VDLQLAYLAAPASAAAANTVQQAPATAQQAAQASFAAHVAQREETVTQASPVEGAQIRSDGEGGGNADSYEPHRRNAPRRAPAPATSSDGEEHFIDTTA
jgi:hypothetical protein